MYGVKKYSFTASKVIRDMAIKVNSLTVKSQARIVGKDANIWRVTANVSTPSFVRRTESKESVK
jgi:hypothetical protein